MQRLNMLDSSSSAVLYMYDVRGDMRRGRIRGGGGGGP